MTQERARILSSTIGNKGVDFGPKLRSNRRQQSISVPYNNEGMLGWKPRFATWTNVFGKNWIAHKSLGFSSTLVRYIKVV